MANLELAEQLRDHLMSAGASLVGFADLSSVEPDKRHGLPVGISIAVALDPPIAASLHDGPTKEYEAEYHRLNALLDELGASCARFLQAQGFSAVALAATFAELDRATLSTPLPHKTAATRAGVGWIGKCALLITEEFGSAVRLTTVVTDADLPLGAPIDEPRCGECSQCIDACPGHAPTGKLWASGQPREDIYDAFACFVTAKSLASAQGIEHIICGKCIAACPWTKGYLGQTARSDGGIA